MVSVYVGIDFFCFKVTLWYNSENNFKLDCNLFTALLYTVCVSFELHGNLFLFPALKINHRLAAKDLACFFQSVNFSFL